jgi:hypothetical protein
MAFFLWTFILSSIVKANIYPQFRKEIKEKRHSMPRTSWAGCGKI